MNPTVNPQSLQNLRQAMSFFKKATNPKALLQQAMNNNPAMGQINSLLQMSNGNYEQAFRTLARQRGLDPDEAVKAILS